MGGKEKKTNSGKKRKETKSVKRKGKEKSQEKKQKWPKQNATEQSSQMSWWTTEPTDWLPYRGACNL